MSNRAMLLSCLIAALAVGVIVASGLPAWVAALLVLACTAEGALRIRRRFHDAAQGAESKLVNSIRWREEQLAHTAHDMRTPLSAIATALEMLREGVASTPTEQSMFLDQASAASRHMAFLIDDVVDLAAIESNRLRLQMREHRVEQLLTDVEKVMGLTAQSQDVALVIDAAPVDVAVVTDRGRFMRITFNLIANAVKFSGPGSKVRVAVECGRSTVRFEVHDLGPGVEESRRGSLFTRFSEAASAGEGSGLGLYVCSMLVACMGGAIGHHPGRERGSVFWFSLPRAECAPSRLTAGAAMEDATVATKVAAQPLAEDQSVVRADYAPA